MVGMILFSTLVISIVINWLGLKLLRYYKFGQTVRADGPKGHYKKEGTPTMGGLMIILSIIVTAVIFLPYVNFLPRLSNEVIIFLGLFAGTGLIGFADDFLKIKNGKNNGLKGRYKILGQFIIAALFCSYLLRNNFHNLVSPLLHYIGMNNPVLYVLLSSFIIIGTSNAVNLTDGLDGLAAGVSTIVLLAFAFIAYQFNNTQLMYLAIFSSIGIFSFLIFNYHPAKMFMGDVGSLSLGTLIAGFALLLHAELYLLLVGLVFVLETLSVIIQVAYFKYSGGKRVFKMAPLHHHFELSGWSEGLIVHSAWLVTLLMVALAIIFRVR
jgi:phospho-N-acetylmuramoyl-pentapeptide-transferase